MYIHGNIWEKIGATILLILIFLFLIFIFIFVPIYKYNDCKRIGHKTLYCIFDI